MDFKAFLADNAKKIEKQTVIVSGRFTENEEPVKWHIVCITALENSRLRSECTSYKKDGSFFDAEEYQSKLCSRCVIYPDLNSVQLQDSYKVKTAEDLLRTMLSAGEYEALGAKVLEVNGFKSEAQLVVEAKN